MWATPALLRDELHDPGNDVIGWRRIQILDPDLADRNRLAVGFRRLHAPQLLFAALMDRHRRGGDDLALACLAEEVGVVVDADRDAQRAEPDLRAHAGGRFVRRAVCAAMHDTERLQVLRADGPSVSYTHLTLPTIYSV